MLVGLITKTDTNPFFVKMREGAEATAEELGIELQSFAGEEDGDNESQVDAVDNLIAAGAAGILITPNDSEAIVPALDRAREAGLLVIALDTPVEPADAADATFATDNFRAGELIGEWAKATFEATGTEARIAMLDLNPNQISVDVARDQGFLEGFGIDAGDESVIGDEDDPRIVGHDVTEGSPEGRRTAMENLLQRDPEHQPRVHDQRARGRGRLRGAEGRRPRERRHDRLGRRRVPRRRERRVGDHRGDVDAVPARHGGPGDRGDPRLRHERREAREHRGPRLRRHRRRARHRRTRSTASSRRTAPGAWTTAGADGGVHDRSGSTPAGTGSTSARAAGHPEERPDGHDRDPRHPGRRSR